MPSGRDSKFAWPKELPIRAPDSFSAMTAKPPSLPAISSREELIFERVMWAPRTPRSTPSFPLTGAAGGNGEVRHDEMPVHGRKDRFFRFFG